MQSSIISLPSEDQVWQQREGHDEDNQWALTDKHCINKNVGVDTMLPPIFLFLL